jgi:hypothetical protein
MIGENNMRWKKYSEEKPTNEEHEYLVKMKGLRGFYEIYSWTSNLSKVDEWVFRGMEEDGFYCFDGEWGFCIIEVSKLYGEDNELYWVDLTELDLELSNGKEMQ